MIRINFLPHRKAKRQQLKAAFHALMVMFALLGLALVGAVGVHNAHEVSMQHERLQLLQSANHGLDQKIISISTLQQDIARLKALAQAVQALQRQRNEAVHLFDELVRQTPQGVSLTSFKQEEQSVSMAGSAQSQERVSGFLSNLGSQSRWLERPELIEIRRTPVEPGGAVEFTIRVGIRHPAVQGGQTQQDKTWALPNSRR